MFRSGLAFRRERNSRASIIRRWADKAAGKVGLEERGVAMSTSHQVYLILSGSIFLLVAVLHFFRLLLHWPIILGPWVAPYWASYVGCPVAAGYCVWALWLWRGRRSTR
jgi:hypothetical protein